VPTMTKELRECLADEYGKNPAKPRTHASERLPHWNAVRGPSLSSATRGRSPRAGPHHTPSDRRPARLEFVTSGLDSVLRLLYFEC